jgi:hypothetical protein
MVASIVVRKERIGWGRRLTAPLFINNEETVKWRE